MANEEKREVPSKDQMERYWDAEKRRREAELRDSKAHEGQLVYFIEIDGKEYPVYHREG